MLKIFNLIIMTKSELEYISDMNFLNGFEKNSLKRGGLSMDKIPNISIKHLKLTLKPKAYKSLDNFMTGKTGIIRDDGDSGIYLWDFERWCVNFEKVKK